MFRFDFSFFWFFDFSFSDFLIFRLFVFSISRYSDFLIFSVSKCCFAVLILRSQGDSASPQTWDDDDDARVSWSRQHTLSTSAMTDLQAAFVINQPYWHFTWMELVISILISLEPAMSTHHIEFMSASSWSPLQAIVLDASFNWVLSSWTFQVCISHTPTFGGAKTDLSHVKAIKGL